MIDLSGVDAKLRRAETHTADLKEAIQRTFDPKLTTFTCDYDPKAGKHVIRVHGVPAIDPDWALIIGEILFNLRSALDHLAWQLVLFDGKKPFDKTQFPIRESSNNQTVQLRPAIANTEVLQALEELQPYAGTQGAHGYRRDPLWRLNKLCNIDKHRLLLVVACVLDVGEMWWGMPLGCPSPRIAIDPNGVQEGAPVAWFDFRGAVPPADFDPHPALAVALKEREVPEISRVPLTTMLEGLCFWVREPVLDWRFRPILAGMPPLMAGAT